MALGNMNNNDSNTAGNVFNSIDRGSASKKVPDSTFFSRVRIKNRNGKSLSFRFSKGLLTMEISKDVPNSFRSDPVISISFSIQKAYIFTNILQSFTDKLRLRTKMSEDEGFGVNCGISDITTSIMLKVTGNITDEGVQEHGFDIQKIDNSGNVVQSEDFIFTSHYDYGLYWTNRNNMEFVNEYDDLVGINLVLMVFKEYLANCTGAAGSFMWDTGRYEVSRFNGRFDALYDKLGIERVIPNYNNSNANTYFSSRGNNVASAPKESGESAGVILGYLGLNDAP